MDGDVQILTEHTVTTADLQRAIAMFHQLSPTVDPADQAPTGRVDQGHRPHRKLPAWGEAHMATVAGGADPSRTGYLCLLAAAVAGWTLSDVQKAVQTAPGLEHYRTRRDAAGGVRVPRRPDEAAARLARQWEKAVDRALWYRYAPQERADRDLSELEAIVSAGEGMLAAFRVSPAAGRPLRPRSTTLLSSRPWRGLQCAQAPATPRPPCARSPASPASRPPPSTARCAACRRPDGSSGPGPARAWTRLCGGSVTAFPQPHNKTGHFTT